MLCPKQEFITEPAKPKMNPMIVGYFLGIYFSLVPNIRDKINPGLSGKE